jgi:hypothetical protein
LSGCGNTPRRQGIVVAGSFAEACRELFNQLHRSNAALSDNSIQTMVENVSPLFRSARSDRIFFDVTNLSRTSGAVCGLLSEVARSFGNYLLVGS